jgi:hypothetical protein
MKIVPFQNLPGEPPAVAIKTCYELEPRIPSPWHRHRGHREANCYVAEGFAFEPNNQPVANPWVAVRTTALDLREEPVIIGFRPFDKYVSLETFAYGWPHLLKKLVEPSLTNSNGSFWRKAALSQCADSSVGAMGVRISYVSWVEHD